MERICKLLLGCKAKHLPPKQSVEFKSLIWSEITQKFAEKCLVAPSLHYITAPIKTFQEVLGFLQKQATSRERADLILHRNF